MSYPASLSGTLSLVLSWSLCFYYKNNSTPQVSCPSTIDVMKVGSISLLKLNCLRVKGHQLILVEYKQYCYWLCIDNQLCMVHHSLLRFTRLTLRIQCYIRESNSITQLLHKVTWAIVLSLKFHQQHSVYTLVFVSGGINTWPNTSQHVMTSCLSCGLCNGLWPPPSRISYWKLHSSVIRCYKWQEILLHSNNHILPA